MTEITAPDGYEIAESIEFEVLNGEVVGGPIFMEDAPEEATPSTHQNRTNRIPRILRMSRTNPLHRLLQMTMTTMTTMEPMVAIPAEVVEAEVPGQMMIASTALA